MFLRRHISHRISYITSRHFSQNTSYIASRRFSQSIGYGIRKMAADGVTSSSLEELQTDEQRRILDTITDVRKQGLEGVLSLPQIVVCGDQSAGKSSVLEALAEIPFPRNDNLCTRFATEISFRREPAARLTIKVIPHDGRPPAEQEAARAFSESITDFSELPGIMERAMTVMGIAESGGGGGDGGKDGDGGGSAFSRDILSIEIEGPNRPQLTLVDIPGLIQSSTKGVSEADVKMVLEITEYYIKQPRTICLAVVSATNDAANQPILQRVRNFDPKGDRTLGVITKPDRLPQGSGSEAKFLELALNEDVFFKLGWHVIKNRSFEEKDCSFEERNHSEMAYFRTSNFRTLPKETVGIDALRTRLSHVLFEHVRNELPRLGEELEKALQAAKDELQLLGTSRSTPVECRSYLVQLNMQYYDICRAAINGNYEHPYFAVTRGDNDGQPESVISRLRAIIQHANLEFSDKFRTQGHKYNIGVDGVIYAGIEDEDEDNKRQQPKTISRKAALAWVKRALVRNRGKELMGNFNPLLIGELFWEQSEGWKQMAVEHIKLISNACEQFLANLLEDKSPSDVKKRIWSTIVQDVLKKRRTDAFDELEKLHRDWREFPINYNHYYTDNIHKQREGRMKALVEKALAAGVTKTSVDNCSGGHHFTTAINVPEITAAIASRPSTPDMDQFGCEEILDCLMAIYKVQHKLFVANVVTQVIERHIVRGLDQIFSPLTVVEMTDAEVQRIVGENAAARRQRAFLDDRVRKLESGREIFKAVLGVRMS